MDLKKEFDEISATLKQQRDEIEVQLHLASMDAKEEWHQGETKWGEFIDALGVITDDSKETSAELIHTTKVIGDELKETYRRILQRLEHKN